MTDEQKEVFQKYENAYSLLSTARESEIFKTGFQYGMRLAVEGIHTEDA